eukprot:4903887-Pyramimonas_sp.AAC.1
MAEAYANLAKLAAKVPPRRLVTPLNTANSVGNGIANGVGNGVSRLRQQASRANLVDCARRHPEQRGEINGYQVSVSTVFPPHVDFLAGATPARALMFLLYWRTAARGGQLTSRGGEFTARGGQLTSRGGEFTVAAGAGGECGARAGAAAAAGGAAARTTQARPCLLGCTGVGSAEGPPPGGVTLRVETQASARIWWRV